MNSCIVTVGFICLTIFESACKIVALHNFLLFKAKYENYVLILHVYKVSTLYKLQFEIRIYQFISIQFRRKVMVMNSKMPLTCSSLQTSMLFENMLIENNFFSFCLYVKVYGIFRIE